MASPYLIQKYAYPAPRYTSYPPVPLWDEKKFDSHNWTFHVQKYWAENPDEPVQIYIHLPYCENLCTFCACNKRITKNHQVEKPYIEAILKEWNQYLALHGGPVSVSEIHLGGGTPTFFSIESLRQLMAGILAGTVGGKTEEMAIEIHPGITSTEQIRALAKMGFSRLSIGIQDFSPFILQKINRHQSFAQTKKLVEEARKCGFHSLNFDLVYGLPFQTQEHIRYTVEKVLELQPDRIAFYGYAHVPWKSKGQRHYTEGDLPEAIERWNLFEKGSEMLQEAGFVSIGLDHFARPEDTLAKAVQEKRLHRNFMGYTDQKNELLIGLGASAISETPFAYAQNDPTIENYLEKMEENQFATIKGHHLTKEDIFWKAHILNLMCQNETIWDFQEPEVEQRLEEMEAEGLLKMENQKIQILPEGHAFMRNICLMLDHRHWRKQSEKQLFSAAV